jgi:uncharacterized protein (TIGR00255 family)
MIRSMTGFGRAELDRNGLALSAEIRTVNHKFCEVSVRLPRSLSNLENRVRLKIQETLTRGKVNMTVGWKDGREQEGELVVDRVLAGQYVKALNELRGEFKFVDAIDLKTLVGLPDVFRWREPTIEEALAIETVDELTVRSLADLLRMREEEGQTLRRDLEARIDTILRRLEVIVERSPVRVGELKEKLRARISQLLAGEAQVPDEKIVVEASFLADRLDCTEEAVRLRSHCDQFLKLAASPEPAGRKLNFLVQEMNREVNTIGSKSNDVDIAREVIVLKEEIEVIREQVQNIE